MHRLKLQWLWQADGPQNWGGSSRFRTDPNGKSPKGDMSSQHRIGHVQLLDTQQNELFRPSGQADRLCIINEPALLPINLPINDQETRKRHKFEIIQFQLISARTAHSSTTITIITATQLSSSSFLLFFNFYFLLYISHSALRDNFQAMCRAWLSRKSNTHWGQSARTTFLHMHHVLTLKAISFLSMRTRWRFFFALLRVYYNFTRKSSAKCKSPFFSDPCLEAPSTAHIWSVRALFLWYHPKTSPAFC